MFLWGTGGDASSSNQNWFTQYGWILTLILSIIFVAAFIVVVIMLVKVKKAENKASHLENASAYIEAFGGKENIVSAEAKSSRLVVVLNDYAKMNEEELKSLGLDSSIKSTNKVTFIVGEQASVIAKEITK